MTLGMLPVAVRLVVGVLVATAFLGLAVALIRSRKRVEPPVERALPDGAEAALWSVVEVMGDPRNHLASKDPTSELRISAEVRRMTEDDLQSRAFGDTPAPRPAELARVERAREARRLAEAKRASRLEAGGAPLPKRPVPVIRVGTGPTPQPQFPARAAS